MSTTDDTVPAAETESAEPATIDALISERHQPLADHEAHKEVGGEPEAAPAAAAEPAAAAATPARVAETPAEKPAAEQPFWYRKEIEKERKARQAAEARAEAAERRPAPQPAREPTERDDPNRPLTRAEVDFIRQQDALIGRLERSEESFIEKHGEEAFEATREWLATRPDIEEWALKQRNPWREAHSQFKKEKLAAEIGEDPAAWRESETARIRAEILAEQAEQDRHEPIRRDPPQMRSAPPAAASTARAAAPRDGAGRYTGPPPIGSLTKNKFS